MSVINNVLKNLETRESGFTPINIPALDGTVESRPAWKSGWPIFLILLPVVALVGYYWQGRDESPGIVGHEAEPVVRAEETMIDVAPVPIEPVALE